VDHRADVYALGVLFYELLTGKLPIGQFEPASREASDAPALADRLINHALAPDPEKRVQTVAQFRTFLQRMLETRVAVPHSVRHHHHRRQSRSAVPAILAAVGVLAAIVAVIALSGGKKKDERAESVAQETPTQSPERVALPPETHKPPVVRKSTPPQVEEKEAEPETKAPVEKPEVTPAKDRMNLAEEAARLGLKPGLVLAVYDRSAPGSFRAAAVVSKISFDWKTGAPLDGAPANFQSRFVGWLGAEVSGDYEFWFWCDDGARLYLDGKLVLDAWSWGDRRNRATVRLDAGWHRLWVEHRDKASAAGVKLYWTAASGEKGVVDARYLHCTSELLDRVRTHPADDPLAGLTPETAPTLVPQAQDEPPPPEAESEKRDVTPAPPKPPVGKPGEWVTLFDGKTSTGWRPATGDSYSRPGRITVESGAVVLAAGKPRTAIVCTRTLPTMNYEIEWEVARLSGREIPCSVTFPVRDTYCALAVWGHTSACFERINGKVVGVKRLGFPVKSWHRVSLRVTEAELLCSIDGTPVTRVPLTDTTTITCPEHALARQPFGLGTYACSAAYRNFRIRRLAP